MPMIGATGTGRPVRCILKASMVANLAALDVCE
jgi:hypothetical protein